jgi:transcriptional regulator with XRE-family HTH domain
MTNLAFTSTLRETLQQARKAKRLSQLELSLRIGVSQRHLSCVESGQTRPSRGLLISWLKELEVPLVIRNRALTQAGFAPIYSSTTTADESKAMQAAEHALNQLLLANEFVPTYVIDAHWNLVDFNSAGRWLARMLMPWTADLPIGAAINLIDLMCMPNGMTQNLINLAEVGPSLLSHIRDDADAIPELRPKAEGFAAFLHSRIGPFDMTKARAEQMAPVLTSHYKTEAGELAFFSMFTTFGTPQDIRLGSLRVEHMFPADAKTREILTKQQDI